MALFRQVPIAAVVFVPKNCIYYFTFFIPTTPTFPAIYIPADDFDRLSQIWALIAIR
jgi:hypothetical protein